MKHRHRSNFVQTVEVKCWSGGTIKVDLDDNLPALNLFNVTPDMFEEFKKILGIATDKTAPMGERLAYIETRCRIMLAKALGEEL